MEYGLVLWWLVAYLAFTLVGMPLAAVLFPRLADRGAGLALPVALAVLWLVVYLVGHLSLTAGIWIGLAVLAAAAGVAVYHGVEIDRRRYGETVLVFTLAFLFLVAIRAVDPAVHPAGGEKFLDFGLLNSILRADRLPPEDMWFAGQPVQYYYGGHLLAAVLTRITGTLPRYGYNLALSGFYAMLVTAAYGLAGSVAASRGVSRVRAGVFGAFFVGFASNLWTLSRLLVWPLPDGLKVMLARAVGVDLGGEGVEGLSDFAVEGPAGFSYWSASRVIDGTINEFPLFAWLNGDLHAHMMSTPFVLLVAGLLFSYFRTPAAERTRRLVLVFGTVPPLAGLLAVVNTWSVPTVGGLTFLTLALAPTDPASLLPENLADRVPTTGLTHELARHAFALAGAAAVVVLGIVWSLPFWLGTASGRSVAFLPDRSAMGRLLLVHGGFLLVFALYLARHSFPVLDRDHADEVAVLLALGVVLAWAGLSAPAVALLGPVIIVGWILLRVRPGAVDGESTADVDRGREAVSDGGTAVTDGTVSEESAGSGDSVVDRFRGGVGFETLLILAGAGIVFLVEFVYVQEQAGPGRFNTVFKTYADVWILWAVGAGAALAHLVEVDTPELAMTGDYWRIALKVLAVVLVVSTSLYGALALTNHFTESGGFYNDAENPSLDALRFADERHPTEAQAITWFDDTVDGQPNIVSKPGTDMYSWDANPVASLTGVPTLVGWHHEVGYRGRAVYQTRVDHANAIYTGSPGLRAHYLREYDIEYIYVGAAEQTAYSRSDLEMFDSMSGVTLEKQWGSDGFVRVYRVNHEELPAAE